ncbi:hypothetical protein ONZ45_g6312 [Pleurotus djamor]|nr:hypothetical protein ONZ45_g6312 [Pleurotus djamor]
MEKVSSAAIQQLKSLYPSTAESMCLHPVLDNPWYLVAAVAFNAARQPESVLSVYKFVLEDLRTHYNNVVDDADHVSLVKKIQEALLKTSITNGIPRTVTTILLLNSIVPKAILETLSQTPLRDFDRSFSDLASHGSQFLSETFGEVEGAQAQGLIKSSTPDIGMFTNVSYGLILGYSSVVSLLETSYIFIAASILDEFPRQARWYYLAAVRQGSTIDQIKAVREMALKVASLSNITLREKVPEVVATELLR